jgi:allophanate hydrolase
MPLRLSPVQEDPASTTSPSDTTGWTVEEWIEAQRAAASPGPLVRAAFQRVLETVRSLGLDPAWITVATAEQIEEQLAALEARLREVAGDLGRFPLFGVPYAVKDNIDVLGFPTTAACPAFSRWAEADARIVLTLRNAGAICFGKTNLDQFATGLVGTRSPYGAVSSAFDASRIGGGSSSGSASVVTRGLVPFALGTDTAGSGRVPAAFQNIVGVKPTRGRWSARGLIPACRTLDCPSVFTLTIADGERIDRLLAEFDPEDPYCRRQPSPALVSPRSVGFPEQASFFGDKLAEAAFSDALSTVGQIAGLRAVDFSAFQALAQLLYAESWVVERAMVAGELLAQPEAMNPVVRNILLGSQHFSARDAFRAEYERARLARAIDRVFDQVDVLCVPTTPTFYRLAEVEADPVGTNVRLGTYTNFTNLADLCGVALPGPFRADGLPAGITLLARAHEEARLFSLARKLAERFALPLGATGRKNPSTAVAPGVGPSGGASLGVPIAVVGAHLSGMRFNPDLVRRGGRLLAETRTSPEYRLYLLDEPRTPRPALRRMPAGQAQTPEGIVVEVWELPEAALGGFLRTVAPPLGLGQVQLRDGAWVQGFVCEPIALEGATDITAFGGYRAFVESRSA